MRLHAACFLLIPPRRYFREFGLATVSELYADRVMSYRVYEVEYLNRVAGKCETRETIKPSPNASGAGAIARAAYLPLALRHKDL